MCVLRSNVLSGHLNISPYRFRSPRTVSFDNNAVRSISTSHATSRNEQRWSYRIVDLEPRSIAFDIHIIFHFLITFERSADTECRFRSVLDVFHGKAERGRNIEHNNCAHLLYVIVDEQIQPINTRDNASFIACFPSTCNHMRTRDTHAWQSFTCVQVVSNFAREFRSDHGFR